MRSIVQKLTSPRGETLVEVLTSILITGLAVALLAGMLAASARITTNARAADQQLYAQLSAAERQDTPIEEDLTLSITVNGDDSAIKVKLYGTPGGLVSYAKGGG
jgi:Tfp pilus assembly protein PilV